MMPRQTKIQDVERVTDRNCHTNHTLPEEALQMNQSSNMGSGLTLNNGTEVTRYVAYVRTGATGEVDGCMSMATQAECLQAYASERGWVITKCYKDEGFSGVTMDRPALKQLMADAEKHGFGRVLVVHIDRLARRIADFSTIVTKLAALSIEVASVTPAFDTSTPAGRLTCGLFATLAEWEKKMSIGDEPLECALISCNFDVTPATRFIGNAMNALLQFQREQGDEYTARSEFLLHTVDLRKKGAQ
jgi:hypothetical protein